ncbi:MAG: DUF1175 family protein [Bryobacterales bacterium]|nr:DUF1175 family protein [Bryobacterales bacterium]
MLARYNRGLEGMKGLRLPAAKWAVVLSVAACLGCSQQSREARAHTRSEPMKPPSMADSFGDGTPDFLRLDTPADRRAFRRWFTFLAEQQFLKETAELPAEVKDCAALVRFSYREALKKHDARWAADMKLTAVPSLPNIGKYSYPFTPLEANLFRTARGAFEPEDMRRGRFAQFADAQTLMLYNTYELGKQLERAQPADLLFFHQPIQDQPFHAMIFLGGHIVYHTGETPGEIRRPTVEELLHHPEPRWRPNPGNPYFLGVYRWNILRD